MQPCAILQVLITESLESKALLLKQKHGGKSEARSGLSPSAPLPLAEALSFESKEEADIHSANCAVKKRFFGTGSDGPEISSCLQSMCCLCQSCSPVQPQSETRSAHPHPRLTPPPPLAEALSFKGKEEADIHSEEADIHSANCAVKKRFFGLGSDGPEISSCLQSMRCLCQTCSPVQPQSETRSALPPL